MIYPKIFPEDRKNEKAEKYVFDKLKNLETQYDIFYSKRFVSKSFGNKPEFEIDFIIAIPEQAILCLEVKGGVIDFSGEKDQWLQNGRVMEKNPIVQASNNSHSLAKLFSETLSSLAVGWGLCFSDCEIQNPNYLPPSLDSNQVIDKLGLLYLDKALPKIFQFIKEQNPSRTGAKRWQYDKFKKILLRNIGFVQSLGTQIKYDDERFIQLTNQQLDIFRRVSMNKSIITLGPAGSGKTILAKTIAQDFINKGLRVLFLCFNRTLANKIRYDFDRREDNIEVSTFHSLARKIIQQSDPNWWDTQNDKNSEDFWNLEIPVKLEETIEDYPDRYDAIIIDEGQDFKEFWFEMVFKLLNKEGYRLVFLDEFQNIFNHFEKIPGEGFFKFQLFENCRNTKAIIKELSEITKTEIKAFPSSPEGTEVQKNQFNSPKEQQKFLKTEIFKLIHDQKIEPRQILILLNSSKEDSSISDLKEIGGLPLKSVDNKGRLQNDAMNYSGIKTFKGLEADVVFILDLHLLDRNIYLKTLYTEASRAKHKIFQLDFNDQSNHQNK